LRKLLTEVALLVFCSVWLFGCVSALTQKLGKATSEPAASSKPGLIKPRMAADPEPQSSAAEKKIPAAASEESKTAKKTEEHEDGKATQTRTSASREEEMSAQAKTADLKAKGVTPSLPLNRATEESWPSARETEQGSRGRVPQQSKEPQRDASGQSQPASSRSAGSDSSKASTTEKEGQEPVFEKHDHAKYVAHIRGKAIDKVNKEKDVTLARLCRDSTTEEWTLTLYHKRQQTYSFVSYVWDEVDGKWEQSLVAGNRPSSGWKQHLDFSSSGKDCKVLKGSAVE
jgi:hypothetical protein